MRACAHTHTHSVSATKATAAASGRKQRRTSSPLYHSGYLLCFSPPSLLPTCFIYPTPLCLILARSFLCCDDSEVRKTFPFFSSYLYVRTLVWANKPYWSWPKTVQRWTEAASYLWRGGWWQHNTKNNYIWGWRKREARLGMWCCNVLPET